MTTPKKRSIDIVQPKYHPSAKPEEAPNPSLSKDDVMMLLEKSQRSQTEMADGSLAPRPDGPPSQDSPPAQGEPGSQPPARRRRPWLNIIGLVALAGAVYFGVQAGSRLFDAWADLTPVTTEEDTNSEAATDAAVTTDTTAATDATESTTASTTTDTAATTSAAAATAAATKTLSVKVLNGNGVAGEAAKVKTLLEAASITVAATGNAKSFGYASTIVYYVAGQKEAADRVAAALTGYQVSTEENAVAEGYDALVVVGAK